MFADLKVLNVRANVEIFGAVTGGAVRKVESGDGGGGVVVAGRAAAAHITRLGRRLGDEKCDREGAGGGGPTRGEFVAAASGGPRGGGGGAGSATGLSFRARAVTMGRATMAAAATAAAECCLRPCMLFRVLSEDVLGLGSELKRGAVLSRLCIWNW